MLMPKRVKRRAINEIGINGENALISQPGDIEALAENLYKILNDIKLMKKISINGYNTVLNFSWDKSVKRFEEILNDSLYFSNKANDRLK